MRHAPVLGPIFAAALVLGAASASANVLVTVDKSTQQMDVSVDGVHRWTWPVSTGVPRYDTPSGTFHPIRIDADHISREWDNAPMPHAIFFTTKGHAIHGELNTRHIGRPASHGCVRLSPAHAAQLYAVVEKEGLPNTTVVLKGDVRVALAREGIRTASGNAGGEALAGLPQSLQPGAYGTPRSSYYAEQQPPDDRYQPRQYGYQPPQSGGGGRARYGRTYDRCPLPPPGFPMPACAEARLRGLQARADQYPPRRYDYGQPQYEPDEPAPFFGRSRAPFGY